MPAPVSSAGTSEPCAIAQTMRRGSSMELAGSRGGRVFRHTGRFGKLAHRHVFACRQRFVQQQILRVQQSGIGGDAIAFRDDDQVPADDLASGYVTPLSAANHHGAGTGQVAQRLEDFLAARLLHERDRHGERGEHQQYQRCYAIADQQVDDTAAEQQDEHRLAQYIAEHAQQATTSGVRHAATDDSTTLWRGAAGMLRTWRRRAKRRHRRIQENALPRPDSDRGGRREAGRATPSRAAEARVCRRRAGGHRCREA